MKRSSKIIYCDYAAATPLDDEVLAAMKPYFAEHFYNPSALYGSAVEARHVLENARANVAAQLGARPAEIIFTAGGTEANNMAIQGVMACYPDAKVVFSAIEHDSVLKTAQLYKHQMAKVNEQGFIDMPALEQAIDESTVLVSVMLANNEVGSLQPLRDIAHLVASICRGRLESGNELPLILHTDACQATNYLDINVARLGVDLMSLNGGKIYGPKQSGVLYVKSGLRLKPLLRGGGQEFGLRSGTENIPGCVGFAVALQKAQALRKEEAQRMKLVQKLFIEQILKNIPQARLHGPKKNRLPNNVHFSFEGLDNERLIMRLDGLGVQAAAGSACSASSDEPSHVLLAIGLNEAQARSSLRFSFGRSTAEADTRLVATMLKQAVTAEQK